MLFIIQISIVIEIFSAFWIRIQDITVPQLQNQKGIMSMWATHWNLICIPIIMLEELAILATLHLVIWYYLFYFTLGYNALFCLAGNMFDFNNFDELVLDTRNVWYIFQFGNSWTCSSARFQWNAFEDQSFSSIKVLVRSPWMFDGRCWLHRVFIFYSGILGYRKSQLHFEMRWIH